MKRCQKFPMPGGTRAEWHRRWHTLLCAECRAARRADQKLARGVRALRQPPVSPQLRADLLERLGLPAGEPERAQPDGRRRTASSGTGADHASVPFVRLLAFLRGYPGAAVGAAVLLAVALGLTSIWTKQDRSGPSEPHRTLSRLPAGHAPSPGSIHLLESPAAPIAVLSPILRAPRSLDPADRRQQGLSPRRAVPGVPHPVASRRGGDLEAMNGNPVEDARWWAPLRSKDWGALEKRVRRTVRVRDDFVQVPFPQVATVSDRQIAEAVESYQREAAIVDARLSREVSLQQKATALSDLCEHLRGETGIRVAAGQSVADEKVTLFCERLALRDVMRQLSRPFGYTWLRSGKAGEYQYELVQDLRSQLLEEELRNRDRNEALIALDREVSRYRPYLGLSPDEALARSKTAPPAEKKLLEKLAWAGWGPIQTYSRLSAQDQAAIRAGQRLSFAQEPGPGDRPLTPDLARGVLQGFRNWNMIQGKDGWEITLDPTRSGATPMPAVPAARARLNLAIQQSELGRMALNAGIFWYTVSPESGRPSDGGGIADNSVEAVSPTVAWPDNALVNAKLAQQPALRPRVSVRPRSSCSLAHDPSDASIAAGTTPEPRVTTADVLEALHRATGLPIVSDYYSRLYKPEVVSVQNQPLFEALNEVADTMRMRWRWDGGWLQLRSTSYYDDRVKEVPNRLLTRWAASRRQHAMLTIDDLCEIAQLPDAQLDAVDMAEGARACFGLQEWELGRSRKLREHVRFLARFTPAQRREAMAPSGLLFTRMPLSQQQKFIGLALQEGDPPLASLEELEGAVLRVDYTQPGGFQWGATGHPGHGYVTRWIVPMEQGPRGRRALRPPVVGRTREEVLQAVRRIDPQLRQALLSAVRRDDPRLDPSPRVVEEDDIFPTRLELAFLYVPGATSARPYYLQTSIASYQRGTAWEPARSP